MVPVIAEESWLKHGFYIIFGTYMLITALFHWLFSHWVLIYLLPILPAAIIGFGYLFLTDELVMYHTTDVVNQLRQYPANEQWLALSIDANKAIVAKDLEELKRVCLRKGVGLLIVTNKNKVVVEIEVKECNLSGKSKNFLSHYKRSKKVQLWI